MVQFPETAETEWKIVADAANAEAEVKARIERATLVEREIERLRIRHEAGLTFQQEVDADLTPELEMLTLASYQSTPALAPTDLIEGVVKDNGLCIVLGPSQSGKSTLALQMFHSLMTGDDWLGQKVQKINGSVGAMSYDMDGSLMLDWMNGFPNVNPLKVSVVNAHRKGHPLGVPALRARIASAWRAMQVEVVLIDSFSASFFGQDQNDSANTMHHYRDLKLFALTEVGARALVVIAHSTDGSPKKPRGSTVHIDVADSIVTVWMPQGPLGARQLEMGKYRQHRDVTTGQFTHMMGPAVLSQPDSVTHLVSLDLSGMTLAGMNLPPGAAAAAAFPDLPEADEEPDLSTDSYDDEDEEL